VVSAAKQPIGKLDEVCVGLPDHRKGPARDGDYMMADMASPVGIFHLLHAKSVIPWASAGNCGGAQRIELPNAVRNRVYPADNYIRLMLDTPHQRRS